MIGRSIGPYQILAELGRGGMGEVYRAHDPKLHRDIAIKILLESFGADPERRQRFEREAQAIAALNHPGIVTIYSVESAGDVLFLTMELVDGKPLSDVIPKQGVAMPQLLRWMIPLADAVSAAHQRGITHRDLKPANVMVSDDGRVKVLDFGLAKLRDHDAVDAGALPTQALTGEGRIVGTVAYMSPEQAEGKPVDHRTDIFSLGILLYEVATGERPFRGDTSASVMASILKDAPPSIADVKAGVPREFARIVKRCLVKDPEHRYQTAKDLRNELEALKEEVDSGVIDAPAATPAPSSSRRRSMLVAAAAVAIIVGIAAAVMLIPFGRRAPAAPAAPRAFDSVRLTQLTNTGKTSLAAISPDGKYVVHVVEERDGNSLWLRQVATTSNVQIVPPADVRYDGLAFAPDGNYVYYSTYAGRGGGNVAWLHQLPILGGTPRRILEDIDSPVSFSPDGKRFAFLRGFQTAGETAVMIANADGTDAKRLAARKNPDSYPLRNLAWSPDGRVVAVPVNVDAGGARVMGIAAIDAATGAETLVGGARWEYVGTVAWVDGGGALAISGARAGEGSPQIWHVPFPDGDPRKITNDLNGYDQITATADSSAVVALQGEAVSHLWVMPATDASRGVEITSGTDRFDSSPAWTPDGRIVYRSNASGNSDIWIVDADGRNARQLTVDPAFDDEPAVTPDGKTILFHSSRRTGGGAGGQQIWKMDIDGGGQTPLAGTAGGLYPLPSPDGQIVFYSSFAGQQRSVWKTAIAGGEPVRVTGVQPSEDQVKVTFQATFVARAISPDGSLLLGPFLDRTRRAFRAGLVSSATGELVNGFDPGSGVSPFIFTPDGKTITYMRNTGAQWELATLTVGGSPKVLTTLPAGFVFDLAWAPDGKRLAVARGTVTNDAVLVSNVTAAPAR